MMTAYIITLAVSAWAIAYGLSHVLARTARILKRPALLPQGVIALGVVLAMLVVVAAPLWLFAALIAAALGLHFLAAPLPLRFALLLAAVPMLAAPLVGGPAGLALDAMLIAASVLGESHAS